MVEAALAAKRTQGKKQQPKARRLTQECEGKCGAPLY